MVEEKDIKEEHKIKKKDKKFQKEVEELKRQLKEEKEKSLRIQAEMINFRKRKEDEVANMYKYANEDILKNMLGIIDNFERALSMENEENKEFLKGFHMIYTSILKIMEDNEVKEIEALDIPFDPSVHQAVMTEHVEGKEPGIVIQVLQKGYKYKERVLRPSMVKVSE